MYRSYLVIMALMMLIYSCEFESTDIEYNMGDHFVDDPANVYLVDTMKLRTYSIVSDSFVTSQASRLLSGRYENEYGIETYCESYFRFDPITNSTLNDNLSAQYDSVLLVLYPDGYKFGDTTKIAGFDIFRLTEEIVYDELTYSIYNTTRFDAEAEPIGEFFIDYSRSFDSIAIRLPDEFGRELYSLIYAESDTLKDPEVFKEEFFKGIKIAPKSDNNTLIMGLLADAKRSEALRIDLHYHDNSIKDEQTLSFKLENSEMLGAQGVNNYYAHSFIRNDYSNSILKGETEDEMLQGHSDFTESKFPATKSNEMTFLQGGYMLSTRIEIPYIDNLSYYGRGAVVKAELRVFPLNHTFNKREDLPQILSMEIINERNEFYAHLYEVNNEDFVYGRLMYNYDFKSKVYYSFDLTNFIKTEYEEQSRPQYSLQMFVPYSMDKPNVDQLMVGSPANDDNTMELDVYFTTF